MKPVANGRALLLLGGIPALLFLSLVAVRLLGLLIPFVVPTDSMTPAIKSNDRILVEGFTFLSRKPRRGDIVCFKSDRLGSLPPGITYLKRIAGMPGETLRLTDDKLYVNDVRVVLSEATREIHAPAGPGLQYLARNSATVTVPQGCYFVLGDHTANSMDSRHFGFVPAANIRARAWLCFWPPTQIGRVK